MLDLFVFLFFVLVFTVIAAVLLHFEKKERCGYCGTSVNPNDMCVSCWEEMEDHAAEAELAGEHQAGMHYGEKEEECPMCMKEG